MDKEFNQAFNVSIIIVSLTEACVLWVGENMGYVTSADFQMSKDWALYKLLGQVISDWCVQ